jgi:hypothetical protein
MVRQPWRTARVACSMSSCRLVICSSECDCRRCTKHSVVGWELTHSDRHPHGPAPRGAAHRPLLSPRNAGALRCSPARSSAGPSDTMCSACAAPPPTLRAWPKPAASVHILRRSHGSCRRCARIRRRKQRGHTESSGTHGAVRAVEFVQRCHRGGTRKRPRTACCAQIRGSRRCWSKCLSR